MLPVLPLRYLYVTCIMVLLPVLPVISTFFYRFYLLLNFLKNFPKIEVTQVTRP